MRAFRTDRTGSELSVADRVPSGQRSERKECLAWNGLHSPHFYGLQWADTGQGRTENLKGSAIRLRHNKFSFVGGGHFKRSRIIEQSSIAIHPSRPLFDKRTSADLHS